LKIIVVFDIPVGYDRLRDRLRNRLKDYGGVFREYSVYEVELDEKNAERMINDIRRIVAEGAGRVDIIFPCRRCYENIIIIDTIEF